MALTGGSVYDPITDTWLPWKPAGPVVDEWDFYTRSPSDAYVCLGVIGNRAHMNTTRKGDHTPRSTHSTVIDGKTVWPKAGWVYAIDGRVPDPVKFEGWLLAQLRAGRYRNLKYFNINNRHYNQKTGWKTPVYSGDDHLHMSFDPGSEYDDSSILADYERYRTDRTESDTMSTTAEKQIAALHAALLTPLSWAAEKGNGKRRTLADLLADLAWAYLYGNEGVEGTWLYKTLAKVLEESGVDAAEVKAIASATSAQVLADFDAVDEAEVAAQVLTGLDVDKLAALVVERMPADYARRFVAAVGELLHNADEPAQPVDAPAEQAPPAG